MAASTFEFSYEEYEDISQLNKADADLLLRARAVTKEAYAPYSKFYVGAVAHLANGEYVVGTNQENASYPVGICAERVLLGNAATSYPGVEISSLAISYQSTNEKSDHPISPCGMCRQALLEYETRVKAPIRIIMGGMKGKIHIVTTTRFLLPFAFTSDELI